MAGVIKISTKKAIALLEETLKSKKASLAQYEKEEAQYEKDVNTWVADMMKESRKQITSITSKNVHHYGEEVRVTFDFAPSRPYPKPKEKKKIADGTNYSFEDSNYFNRQVKQLESLLQMLKLTDDEYVNASVYKDIASLM